VFLLLPIALREECVEDKNKEVSKRPEAFRGERRKGGVWNFSQEGGVLRRMQQTAGKAA